MSLVVLTVCMFALFVTTAHAGTITSWTGLQPTGITGTNLPIIANGTGAKDAFPMSTATGRISIDGVALPTGTYTATARTATSVYFYHNPKPALADGSHTFRVEMSDTAGKVSFKEWGVMIAQPPTATWLEPVADWVMYSGYPRITMRLADNTVGTTMDVVGAVRTGSATGPVLMSFGGNGLSAGDHSFGLGAELPPGTYYLTATITDAAGNARLLQGAAARRFTTMAAPAMSVLPTNCLAAGCHVRTGHPAQGSDCASCHVNGYHENPNCGECHDAHTGPVTVTDMFGNCESCHNVSYPSVPRHTVDSVRPNHDASCNGCHYSNLLDVHGVIPTGKSYAYQCDLCHESTDPLVSAAIVARDASCGACHAVDPNHGTFTKASSHNVNGTGESVDVDNSVTAFLETLSAEFSGAPVQDNVVVTNLSGGEVRLGQDLDPQYTIDPEPGDFVMYSAGRLAAVDLYTPDENAWNLAATAYLDPEDFSGTGNVAERGAKMFTLDDGNLYQFMGAASSRAVYRYNPPTLADPNGSWTSIGNAFSANPSNGSDLAVNVESTALYATQGNSSANILGWNYFTNSNFTMQFAPGGTNTNLGVGSSIVYAPGADRLFVVINNGSTANANNGRIAFLDAPGTKIGAQTFTLGPAVVRAAPNVNEKAAYGKIAGTEYIFVAGPNPSNVYSLAVVSNLGGTPVTTPIGKFPTGWTWGADTGAALAYNPTDGYLYMLRGTTAGFARILVPSDPTVAADWGNWEILPITGINGTTTQERGATLGFISLDPVAYLPFRFYGTGTFGGTEVMPAAGSSKWGTVSWDAVVPADSALTVQVEAFDGDSWTTLISAASAPVDLSAYTTAQYPKLRLSAKLESFGMATSTPILNSWVVTSLKTSVVVQSSLLSCDSCHGNAAVIDGVKLTAGTSESCLKCHTGTLDEPFSAPVGGYPYDVLFRTITSPFFAGWSKTVAGIDFAGSVHGSALECSTCHDKHESDNASLLAFGGDTTSAVAEEKLCFKCHGAGSGAGMDVQGPETAGYSHPASDVSGKHSNTESSADLAANRHAECGDCHNAHAAKSGGHTRGSNLAAPALNGVTGVKVKSWPANWGVLTAGDFEPELIDGESTDFEALVCLKCHSTAGGPLPTVTTPSGTYTPTNIAQEFNPNNAAGHNVLGSTFPKNSYTVGGTTYAWDWRTNATFQAGWSVTSKVTCSDCHTGGTTTQAKGPHGSTARWMIDPQYTTQYRLANNASSISTTLLCVKCHANIRNANNVHSSSNHNVRCVRCHIGIPHGWKRPRMIVYASDPAPYKSPEFTTGMTGLTVRARAGGSYSWNSSSTDCATNCTTRHSAAAPYIP